MKNLKTISFVTTLIGLCLNVAHASDEVLGRAVIVKRVFEISDADIGSCIGGLNEQREAYGNEYSCVVAKQNRLPYEVVASQEGRPLGNGVHLWGSDTGFEFVVWSTAGVKNIVEARSRIKNAIRENAVKTATAIVYTRE